MTAVEAHLWSIIVMACGLAIVDGHLTPGLRHFHIGICSTWLDGVLWRTIIVVDHVILIKNTVVGEPTILALDSCRSGTGAIT